MSTSGGEEPAPIILSTVVNNEHVVECLASLSSEDIYLNDSALEGEGVPCFQQDSADHRRIKMTR
jgi:hypothetical protein